MTQTIAIAIYFGVAVVACNSSRAHTPAPSISAASVPPLASPPVLAQPAAPSPVPAIVTARAHAWSFDADTANAPPPGFSFSRTGGGAPGRWVIHKDDGSPSGSNVLAQLDSDNIDYRFPIAIADLPVLRNGTVSVRCKSVSGSVDQACGLVFRYRDVDNYYVVRANALENNVRLYHVVKGDRSQFAGWNGTVASGRWHLLQVTAKDDHFVVFWDEMKVIDAHDATFTEPGKVGVWTKADSVTYFDDLHVEPVP